MGTSLSTIAGEVPESTSHLLRSRRIALLCSVALSFRRCLFSHFPKEVYEAGARIDLCLRQGDLYNLHRFFSLK